MFHQVFGEQLTQHDLPSVSLPEQTVSTRETYTATTVSLGPAAMARSSVVLFGGAISAILLALLLTRLFYSPPDDNFVCSESDLTSSDPPPPGECFIRENYRESKDQFLNLSKVVLFASALSVFVFCFF
jgi:hypothetical protein